MNISLPAKAWREYFSAADKNDSPTDPISRFSAFLPAPEQSHTANSSSKNSSGNLEAYAVPLVQLPVLITQKKATTNTPESKEKRKQQQREQ